MKKYMKYTAMLAAAILLSGCSGNAPDKTPQPVTVEADQTTGVETAEDVQTSESLSPAGEGTAEGTPAGGTSAQPDDTSSGGVTLVSGGDSLYSDIFELNGSWCDVGELPFNVVSCEVPLLKSMNQYDSLIGFIGGKLHHLKYTGSQVLLLAYDLTTGEDELVYDITDLGSATVWFVNEQYLVIETGVEEGNRLIVTDLQKDQVVFDTPIESGNIMFDPAGGVQIVYDMMYLTAKYTMPEFNKTWNIGITVELNTGEIGLYGYGFNQVYYGVGNVCYADRDRIESIHGETVPRYGEHGDNENTYTWYNMLGTYYTTYDVERGYDVLGSRTELFWSDRNNTEHRLGQTSFSVDAPSGQFFMNRDNIFTAKLTKTTPIQIDGDDSYEIKNWLIVGKYDVNADSAQASLIELNGSLQKTYVTNDCIYLLDFGSCSVTMLYA